MKAPATLWRNFSNFRWWAGITGGCNEGEHHRARLGDGVEQEAQTSAILQKCLREANG